MATTNYNLPTIAGNMTADVVRDMNALAEATDNAIKEAVDGVDLSQISQSVTDVDDRLTTHLAEKATVGVEGHVTLIDSVESDSLLLAPTAKAAKFLNDARISHADTTVYDGVHGLKIEEGIWTPILKSTTVNGTHQYALQNGIYIKQNKQVTVLFNIVLSTKDELAQGNLFIDGLPFVIADQNASCTLSLVNCNLTTNDKFITAIGEGVAIKPFAVQPGAGGYLQLTQNHLLNNFVLQGSMTYKTI